MSVFGEENMKKESITTAIEIFIKDKLKEGDELSNILREVMEAVGVGMVTALMI